MEQNSYPVEEPKQKKKNNAVRYIVYIVVVLIATGLSLAVSLWGDQFDSVIGTFADAFKSTNGWFYILISLGVVALSYFVDALIILISAVFILECINTTKP